MGDSEDLKKIDDIIKKHKTDAKDPDEVEYAEFIDYDDDPNDADYLPEIEEFEFPKFAETDITKFNTYAPSQFLADNEKITVNSCTDPVLKDLLLLNRTKNTQLMQIYKKIKDLLVECQANIAVYEKNIKAFKGAKKVYPKVWRLGIPYFKSVDDYPCPRNGDVIRKHNNGELFFYDMTPSTKWSVKDINRLFKGVAFQYTVNRETELEKLIRDLEEEVSEDLSKHSNEETIQELKNKLEDVRSSEDVSYPPMGCEKYLDWSRLSQQFFQEKYSSKDCQIFWKTYLHPDINKSAWSAQENDKLKSLAIANNCQNWDHIAKELGGNRTGFLACVHYYCKIDPPRCGGRFTPTEDKKLCDLVEKYRQGEYVPWTKVAHHFSKRTRGQLYYRHRYFLSCRGNTLKGKFSKAEDILILVLVNRFGKKFSKCGEYFPYRSVVQMKARYSSNLKGAIKKGSFTIEDDRQILEYVKQYGTANWEPMVKVLSRCGGQIRQRYKTLIAFQNANPEAGLEQAPRRRFHGISYNAEYDYLRLMADKFKSYEKIPTLEEIEMLLESNPKPKAKPLIPLPRSKNPQSSKEISYSESRDPLEIRADQCEKRISSSKGKCNDSTDLVNQTVNTGTSKTQAILPKKSPELEECDNDETPLPSLAVDDFLIDFFSTSVKLHFEQNLKIEEIHKAASALNNILSILQVELYVPKNYKEDSRLDAIDMDILDILIEDRPITITDKYVIKGDDFHIDRIIPPNLNTMVGLRSLLLKNEIYRTKCVKRTHLFENFRKEDMEKQVLWCINNYLSNQSEEVRNELILERDIFFRRFILLFKFPAIMSLVTPSKRLETSANQWKGLVIRTYKKRPKTNLLPCQTISDEPIPFEGVFIKQSEHGDYKIEANVDLVQNNTQLAPKLSMVDQLKRKINQTIHDLTNSPPAKRFFHEGTPFIKRESDCPNEPPQSSVVESDVRSQKSITTVISNNVPKIMNKRRERDKVISKTSLSSVAANNVQQIMNKKSYEREKVTKKTIVTKNVAEPLAPAPIKCYNRTKAKKKCAAAYTESLVDIKSEQSVPDEIQSNFDFGKGELILEDDVPNDNTITVNQDLQDVQLLDDILKKEKHSVDESFDF